MASPKKRGGSKGMALFDRDELKLGMRLGEGGYSHVHEIDSIQPNLKIHGRQKSRHEAARKFLAQHVRREDGTRDARYAIKFLKDSLDEKLFEMATIDLKAEATILSAVEHPNIIKVRGWAAGGGTNAGNVSHGEARDDSYFIILDRLYDTLDDRMIKWREDERSLKAQITKERGPLSRFSRRRKANIASFEEELDELLATRLKVAHDIASALQHLHSRRLVYRDLKPSNIGFDIQDDTKMFDLGLSRELPQSKHQEGVGDALGVMTDVFEMSGGIGTRRYMAPEIARCEPYNETCDVYSFGLVLWELVAMKKPFAALSREMHEKRVVRGGERPKLEPSCSKRLHDIMTRAWHEDLRMRPPMKEIVDLLREEIVDLRGGATTGLVEEQSGPDGLLRRRSTHVVLDLSFSSVDDSERQRRVQEANASLQELMMDSDSAGGGSQRSGLLRRGSSRVLFMDSSSSRDVMGHDSSASGQRQRAGNGGNNKKVLFSESELESSDRKRPGLLRRRSSQGVVVRADSQQELDEESADATRRSIILHRIPSLANIHEGLDEAH